jgi:hypothetical protein
LKYNPVTNKHALYIYNIALHCITLRYVTLHYVTFRHFTALRCVALY